MSDMTTPFSKIILFLQDSGTNETRIFLFAEKYVDALMDVNQAENSQLYLSKLILSPSKIHFKLVHVRLKFPV